MTKFFTPISNVRIVCPFVDKTNTKNKNAVFQKLNNNTQNLSPVLEENPINISNQQEDVQQSVQDASEEEQ